ncbi:MAG: hypothetical protein KatS3mg091_331 [Patescibacteria group bacterium]|nr:MAG: hypothetical protein KatS3mg091_331 [Patescibacteria group bacterium]
MKKNKYIFLIGFLILLIFSSYLLSSNLLAQENNQEDINTAVSPSINKNQRPLIPPIKKDVIEERREAQQDKQAQKQEQIEQMRQQKQEQIERMREEKQKRLEELKQKRQEQMQQIREDKQAKMEEFRQKLQQIKDERKQQIVERVSNRVAELNDRHAETVFNWVEKISDFLAKLEGIVNRLAENGADVVNLQTQILTIKENLESLKSDVEIQREKEYIIEINDEQTLGLSLSKAYSQLRADYAQLRSKISEIKASIRNLAVNIRQTAESFRLQNNQDQNNAIE